MSPVIFGMLIFGLIYFRLCTSRENIDGVAHYENGEYEKALACFNDYLMLNPHDTKTLYNRGKCYEIFGETKKALHDYFEVLDRDPENINALLSCTKICYETGELQSAVYLSTHAVLLDEDNYLAHYYNGRALHKSGDLDGALSGYSEAIRLNPQFGLAYLQRSSVMLSIGYYRFGCNDLKIADSLNVEGAKVALQKYCNF